MKLYDSLINSTHNLIKDLPSTSFDYDSDKTWQETDDFEIIFQRDVAKELGGSGKSSLNYTCVTTNKEFFNGSKVVIIGKDIKDLEANSNFTRVTEVLIEDLEDLEDTDKLYNIIQDIDFVKYHVYPKGYMVRISGQTNNEQVRISKDAVSRGISFEHIGNTMIEHYRKNPLVNDVRVIFITDDTINYSQLKTNADSASEIKNSLSKINKGMPTECSTCGIKEICNEVEGLKELHFGVREKKTFQSKIL